MKAERVERIRNDGGPHMWAVFLLFIIMVFAGGCHEFSASPARAGQASPAGADAAPLDLRERGHYVVGLYYTRDPGSAALEAFRREAATTPFEVIAKKGSPQRNDPDTVYMASPSLADAPPPPVEHLELFARGFSESDARDFAKVAAVRVMAFSLREPVGVRAADLLIERVASNTGAYVYDTSTRELFTLAAWHANRVAAWNDKIPQAARQVAVHGYRDGERYRAVSLGMEKFGLPDVAVNEIAGVDLPRIDVLMQLTLQALVEQGTAKLVLKTKGANLEIPLAPSTPEDGDAENRLFAIRGDLGPLLDRVGEVDTLKGVRGDDAEIAAAVAKVQSRIPALARRFAAGLGPSGVLRVKASFDGEAMWIDVKLWKEGVLRGPLRDHPQVAAGLVAGQTVSIREGEVLDYQLSGVADPEGPFLDEILRRKGQSISP